MPPTMTLDEAIYGKKKPDLDEVLAGMVRKKKRPTIDEVLTVIKPKSRPSLGGRAVGLPQMGPTGPPVTPEQYTQTELPQQVEHLLPPKATAMDPADMIARATASPRALPAPTLDWIRQQAGAGGPGMFASLPQYPVAQRQERPERPLPAYLTGKLYGRPEPDQDIGPQPTMQAKAPNVAQIASLNFRAATARAEAARDISRNVIAGDEAGKQRAIQAYRAATPLEHETATTIPRGLLQRMAQTSAATVGGWKQGIQEGGIGGLIGGIVGGLTALGAGQLGPQVGAIEELVTVPKGIAIGASIGGHSALALSMYERFWGENYMQMIDTGTDPKIAEALAGWSAAPQALIEIGQIKGLTPKLAKEVNNVARKSLMRVLMGAAKQYGATVVKESWGEEVPQQAIEIVTQDVANYLEGKGVDFSRARFKKDMKRLYRAGGEAMLGFAPLALPGAVMDLQYQARQQLTLPPTEGPKLPPRPTQLPPPRSSLLDLLESQEARARQQAQIAEMGEGVPQAQPMTPPPAAPPVVPTPATTQAPLGPAVVAPQAAITPIAEPAAAVTPAPAEAPTPTRVSAEEAAADTSLTSGRQAWIDRDLREVFGMNRVNSKERQSMQEWMDQAQAEGIPQRALAIAQDLHKNPRPLTKVEEAGMARRMGELKLEFKNAERNMNAAANETDKRIWAAEAEYLRAESYTIYDAVHMAGSEWGGTGRAIRLTIDENLDLVSVLSRAKIRNEGKPLKPAQEARFRRGVGELESLEDLLSQASQERDTWVAEEAIRLPKASRYAKMTIPQLDAEMNTLNDELRTLLAAGCYDLN